MLRNKVADVLLAVLIGAGATVLALHYFDILVR